MTPEEVRKKYKGCEKCRGTLELECVYKGTRICTICVRNPTDREILTFGHPLPAWTKQPHKGN